MTAFGELLQQKTAGFCRLGDAQLAALEGHYQLMVRWNRSLNLTRVESLEAAVERHYAESLFLAFHLGGEVTSAVDIGSGAGFPGVPLAVARPGAAVTLVESHQRKAVFLREATRGMANVRVEAVRGEHIQGPFDALVSRAVAYSELKRFAGRLARRVALLVGASDSPEIRQDLQFHWAPAVQLPWGESRVLLIGERASSGSA